MKLHNENPETTCGGSDLRRPRPRHSHTTTPAVLPAIQRRTSPSQGTLHLGRQPTLPEIRQGTATNRPTDATSRRSGHASPSGSLPTGRSRRSPKPRSDEVVCHQLQPPLLLRSHHTKRLVANPVLRLRSHRVPAPTIDGDEHLVVPSGRPFRDPRPHTLHKHTSTPFPPSVITYPKAPGSARYTIKINPAEEPNQRKATPEEACDL